MTLSSTTATKKYVTQNLFIYFFQGLKTVMKNRENAGCSFSRFSAIFLKDFHWFMKFGTLSKLIIENRRPTGQNQAELSVVSSCILALSPVKDNCLLGRGGGDGK